MDGRGAVQYALRSLDHLPGLGLASAEPPPGESFETSLWVMGLSGRQIQQWVTANFTATTVGTSTVYNLSGYAGGLK